MLKAHEDLKLQYRGNEDHPPQISEIEFKLKSQELAESSLEVMHTILGRAHFNEKAPCSFCKRDCYVSPRSDPIFGKMRWTEVGGNVCRPWSKMGAQHGIIDAATLPMLVWIYSMRFYEPDDIINECVADFDPNILLRVLNEDDNEAPKHHASRPLRVGEFHTRTFGMFSIKMRPPDVGIPSNGLRVFSHFSLSEFVKSCVPAHLQKDVFKSLFFCECRCDASIYMVDCGDLREKFRFEWAGKRPEDRWWSSAIRYYDFFSWLIKV